MVEEIDTQPIQHSEVIVAKDVVENPEYPQGTMPFVYLDRTDPYNTGTELQIDEMGPQGLPQFKDDVIVWTEGSESYYEQTDKSEADRIPAEVIEEYKKQFGTEKVMVLRKISMIDAETERKAGKAVATTAELIKAHQRYGKPVDKLVLEKSAWQDKKEASKVPLGYEKHNWVVYQGFEKGTPLLTPIKEVIEGQGEVALDIPELNVSLTSEADDKFLQSLVLKVPSDLSGSFRLYKFSREKPPVRDQENELPYGFLKELSPREQSQLAKTGIVFVEPSTLRETWDNYGRVSADTIQRQLLENAEDSLKIQADKDREDLREKREEFRRGLEKFKASINLE